MDFIFLIICARVHQVLLMNIPSLFCYIMMTIKIQWVELVCAGAAEIAVGPVLETRQLSRAAQVHLADGAGCVVVVAKMGGEGRSVGR